jgi:hypothetical protein
VNRLVWIAFFCSLLAAVLLGTLAVMLWPPGPAAAALLGIGGLLLALALILQALALLRDRPSWQARGAVADDGSAGALIEQQIRALEEQERRLELRELRLARHMRINQQLQDDRAIDLTEAHPSDEELAGLVETDRQLMALIETESRRAFERVRENRYASGEGVDTGLILADLRAFVHEVARLYRPDTADPLLETDIELLAKSTSSTALHLLVVVDGLPLDLKSYNLATIYRLIRKGAAYYGTYKAVRPYLDHGLTALQAARLALGMNPATVGATWLAGKLTVQGAKVFGERFVAQQALTLLHDFIRVVGFEAAMVYGGSFRHRDANWVLGTALVNLEIARGEDAAGRTAAIGDLCRLALRHEFDRLRLLRHLADARPVPVDGIRPAVIMTPKEREGVAKRLTKHCRATDVDPADPDVARWREGVEALLELPLDLPVGERRPSRLTRLRGAMGRLRARRGARNDEREDTHRGELG